MTENVKWILLKPETCAQGEYCHSWEVVLTDGLGGFIVLSRMDFKREKTTNKWI